MADDTILQPTKGAEEVEDAIAELGRDRRQQTKLSGCNSQKVELSLSLRVAMQDEREKYHRKKLKRLMESRRSTTRTQPRRQLCLCLSVQLTDRTGPARSDQTCCPQYPALQATCLPQPPRFLFLFSEESKRGLIFFTLSPFSTLTPFNIGFVILG